MEEINKKEFVLKISSLLSKEEKEFQEREYGQIDNSIKISAWDKVQKYMIGKHICSQFKELENIGIYDESEGEMEYTGNLSIKQLTDKLISAGFNVQ